MTAFRLLLLHGVATRGSIWNAVIARLGELDGIEILAPDRPATGDLSDELEWLAPLAEGAFVVGFSGGATLGLALAASPVRMRGAMLHEPAVGSLLPGLLAPVAAAYAKDGYEGFGSALYGPGWQASMVDDAGASVARELPMFRAFEPAAASAGQGPTVITVGERSPQLRHDAAAALRSSLGFPVEVLPGCGHFAVHDNPAAFAAGIGSLLEPAG